MRAEIGTYLSEVYRGALEGVPKTQWEACRALNFSMFYTYRKLVLPQAFPIAIPGMGNYLVGIFKDTPLLSTIGVAELFHAATAVGGYHYRYLEPYTIVGIIFFQDPLTVSTIAGGGLIVFGGILISRKN